MGYMFKGDKMIVTNDTFGSRLNFVMKENKITNKYMSELLSETYDYSISKESIAKYRNDERTPEPVLIKYLSDILSVSTDYLLGIDKRQAKTVPVIGVVSCGGDQSVTNLPTEQKRTAYYNADEHNGSMYCIIANGNGMSPEIDDRDEVICNPKITPSSGDLVHYKIGEENAIKILFIDEEAHLIQLVPYNITENFKATTIRMDDERFHDIIMSKVVAVNKLTHNHKEHRLKMIGRT